MSGVEQEWTVLMRATPARRWRIRLLQWLTPALPLVVLLAFLAMPEAELQQDFGSGHWQITGPLLITGLAALLPASLWFALVGAYVLEIAQAADGSRLRLQVLGAFGVRRLEGPTADFVPGAVVAPRGRVQTPVFHLVAPGGRRLMVDLQAEFPLGMPETFERLARRRGMRA